MHYVGNVITRAGEAAEGSVSASIMLPAIAVLLNVNFLQRIDRI